MPPEVLTVVAAYTAEAIAAVLLAAVLRGLGRAYRREYLRHWEWSWWALAVYLATGALARFAAVDLPATHWVRLLVSSASQIAGYWQVLWLLTGTHQVATGRAISRRASRILLTVLAVVGVVSVLLFVAPTGDSAGRFLVRVGVRSLAAGVAFLVAATLLWPGWFRRGRSGRGLLSIGLFLYGLQQTHYFVIALLRWVSGSDATYAPYLTLGDVVLHMVMGLGMVLWLLEEERAEVLRATEKLEHLAFHDTVTGLPNRRLVLDRLIQAVAVARRRGEGVAVLVLGLDRFREINDVLGHASGDEVLRAAAARLSRAVRDGDTVGRLGGDEYALALPGMGGIEDAREMAARVRGALGAPLQVRGREFVVTASGGLALFPDHGDNGEALLLCATAAMHGAKEHGGNSLEVYAAATPSPRGAERLSLERELRGALEAGEIELYYQPIVAVVDGSVVAVEALLRWRHPQTGVLPAAEFVPVAEKIGVIDDLNRWALDAACRALPNFGASRMCVNLSARTFQRPGLVDLVEDLLRDARVAPGSLELEITETVAMRDVEATMAVFRALKRLGVRLAIDDFGTGYSSLSYLRNFPIDTLKVDQTFVRDLPGDRTAEAILGAVVAMARGLSLELVAEGVEKPTQYERLAELGCDLVQGYVVAPPMPIEECVRFLGESRSPSGRALRVVG